MKKQIDISDYKFSMPLQLRWNDLDALGHVNNVLYIDYFQNGRGAYMNAVSSSWDWSKHMFVIANINCDYVKEIKMNVIKPQIGMRIMEMGTKSFVIHYVIFSQGATQDTVIHAVGTSTQVMIDTSAGKSIPIPDWLRRDVHAFENLV